MEILQRSKKGCAAVAGRLKEGFPEEVALLGPSPKREDLKRVEMGMGEGRAIQSEGSTNGSGVGVEGGHEARGVLLSLESKAARGRGKHVMLHASCCIYVSVLHATGSMFALPCPISSCT